MQQLLSDPTLVPPQSRFSPPPRNSTLRKKVPLQSRESSCKQSQPVPKAPNAGLRPHLISGNGISDVNNSVIRPNSESRWKLHDGSMDDTSDSSEGTSRGKRVLQEERLHTNQLPSVRFLNTELQADGDQATFKGREVKASHLARRRASQKSTVAPPSTLSAEIRTGSPLIPASSKVERSSPRAEDSQKFSEDSLYLEALLRDS